MQASAEWTRYWYVVRGASPVRVREWAVARPVPPLRVVQAVVPCTRYSHHDVVGLSVVQVIVAVVCPGVPADTAETVGGVEFTMNVRVGGLGSTLPA